MALEKDFPIHHLKETGYEPRVRDGESFTRPGIG